MRDMEICERYSEAVSRLASEYLTLMRDDRFEYVTKGQTAVGTFLSCTERHLSCFLRVVRHLHSPIPHEKQRKYLLVARRGIRIGSRPTTESAPWRRDLVALDD